MPNGALKISFDVYDKSGNKRLAPNGTRSGTVNRPFSLVDVPVPWDRVTYINWYGNTNLAYEHRHDWYDELQGLHSGVDFLIPIPDPNKPSPIYSIGNQPGRVVAIMKNGVANPAAYNFQAGPNSVLVDYGDYLILYGHTSATKAPPKGLGQTVNFGDVVAYSGKDGSKDGSNVYHLHLEVLPERKVAAPFVPGDDITCNKLPDGQTPPRPAEVRINPVPFWPAEVITHIGGKKQSPASDFHPNPESKWLTPTVQERICPGGPLLNDWPS